VRSTPATGARRIGVQAPLGFSAGVPLLLTGGTLSAWLTSEQVSLRAVGAFALVSLPYNLKFLWAPALDRFGWPWLGRRRDWMILTQSLLAVAIAAMGVVDARASTGTLALLALAVAFLSASQDVVVDAYRTDLLGEGERGKGTAAYVTGYRVAMLVTGAGALIVADHISWRLTYWVMAALLSVGVVATLAAPRLPATDPPSSLRHAVIEPLRELFARRGAWTAIAFVMLYKVGDALAGHMATPFLIKLDFSMSEIGVLQKFLGAGATLAGAAVGGAIADKIGTRRALLWFGAAQALANIGYVGLAATGKSYPMLVVAIGVDNACNGLGTTAFVAYLMSICHDRFSATQYAVLTSASSLLGRLLNATSGDLIAAMGWAGFFAATIALAGPALLLIRFLPRSLTPAHVETN
jgi:MFS transporter, PAT family, beta-lactamase induction signal transducer AmpG